MKSLGLNNINTKNATNSKYGGFIIYIQAIVYMLLHNLHNCTFKTSFKLQSIGPIKTTLHLDCIKLDGGLYLPELIFLEQHLFVFCLLLSSNFVQRMFSLENINEVTISYSDVIVYDKCSQCLCCNFPCFKGTSDGYGQVDAPLAT